MAYGNNTRGFVVMDHSSEAVPSWTPEEVPQELYHFTSPQNIPSILSKGLIPSKDRLGNPSYVWMNEDLEEVKGAVNLIIHTRGLDRTKFSTFGEGHVFLYSGRIPSKNIEVVE